MGSRLGERNVQLTALNNLEDNISIVAQPKKGAEERFGEMKRFWGDESDGLEDGRRR